MGINYLSQLVTHLSRQIRDKIRLLSCLNNMAYGSCHACHACHDIAKNLFRDVYIYYFKSTDIQAF